MLRACRGCSVGMLWNKQGNTVASHARRCCVDISECFRRHSRCRERMAERQLHIERERGRDEWLHFKTPQQHLRTFSCKNVHEKDAWWSILASSECVSVVFHEPATPAKNANLHSWSVISLLLSPRCCLLARLSGGSVRFKRPLDPDESHELKRWCSFMSASLPLSRVSHNYSYWQKISAGALQQGNYINH